jgi:hypothetical protein
LKKTLFKLCKLFCERLLKDKKIFVHICTFEKKVKNMSVLISQRISTLFCELQSEKNKNEQQEVDRTSNPIRLHLRIPIQMKEKE